jgi:hypothetical protein
MHSPAVLENYTLVSTQVPWTYTQALMDFKVGGVVAFWRTVDVHCASVRMNEPCDLADCSRRLERRKRVRYSCAAPKLRPRFRITVV